MGLRMPTQETPQDLGSNPGRPEEGIYNGQNSNLAERELANYFSPNNSILFDVKIEILK